MALMNPVMAGSGKGPVPSEPGAPAKSREPIEAGRLPRRRPDRMWAGLSAGGHCAICGTTVKLDEMEYELEFARKDHDSGVDRHRVHIQCFSAFISSVHEDVAGPSAPPSLHQT